MSAIAIAGLYTHETNLKIEGFPLPYYPVAFPFDGISGMHSGVGLNLALALGRLGQQVRLATLIGPDEAGDHLIEALPRMGLASDFVARASAATSQSVILVAPDGRRQAHCDLKDLQRCDYPRGLVAPLLADAELAVICNINFARPLLGEARARGIPIATDVHVLADFDDDYNRDFIAASDILFLSHERLPCPPHEAIAELRRRFDPRIIVIGMGEHGALLSERGQDLFHAPALAPRTILNTIGAGDALFASFLDQLLRTAQARTALVRATLYAGWKIGESGASQGLLDASGFSDLIQRHGIA